MGEHLCFLSSLGWHPETVFLDQGVCEDDEFSHDGSEGDLGLFSLVAQAILGPAVDCLVRLRKLIPLK